MEQSIKSKGFEHRLLLIMWGLLLSLSAFAQQITVKGHVVDATGEPVIGASVIEGKSTNGTITDIDGNFSLNVSANSALTISFVGYKTQTVSVNGKTALKVTLQEDTEVLDEVVVVGYGTMKKSDLTGAVSSVGVKDIKDSPVANIGQAMQGKVSGVQIIDAGKPGDNVTIKIRGLGTINNSNPLVVIDGIPTDLGLSSLNMADVERVDVLKDASATAVYGVRGANGVVIVTTKRGKAGKLTVNFKTNATYSYSPRMPEYVDAVGYANLANEARVVRGKNPIYTNSEIQLFRSGLDPDLYPNVNWRDVILNDYVINNQHHLSLSGGGTNARYYVSMGIMNQGAVFKQDKSASKHNTNVDYHQYNFRANVDANMTKTTLLSLNMETIITKRNSPGYGDNNNALWAAQANLPATIVPVKYSNGTLPSFGKNSDEVSPYVQLNYTGYKISETQATRMNASLNQKLDFITKGLSARGVFSFNYTGYFDQYRTKTPDLYYATGRKQNGALISKRTWSATDMTYGDYRRIARQYYFEGNINYERIFGEDHRVTGLLNAYRQENKDSYLNNDDDDTTLDERIRSIPKRYQAISARATYSYKDTYMFEFNVGYTGSEQFKKGNRYGWFPAVALGWVPTQYEWTREKLPFLDFFKLRASLGKVGNDRIKKIRFPYLSTVSTDYSSVTWPGSTVGETRVGANDLNWEETTKMDIGVDLKMFNDKVELTADIFKDKNKGIFQQRANIPEEAGFVTNPYTNIGGMESWGFDGNITFNHNFTKDFGMTVRGNWTFARNNVTYWEQSGVVYPYQSFIDVPYGVQRGLISLGLFKDQADIESSPVQTYSSDVRPGDIKYKDVNGDGVINDDDIVPLSYSNTPTLQYGFAAEFRYKQFTASIFFEGVGKVQYFYGGSGYYPFAWETRGNVLNIVADQKNRWIPREYSGDASTENPNARFPRLTYGENKNNNRASTFWLADGRYFRLKNIELSYRFTSAWLRDKISVQNATLSFVGENLHVWDKVKLWDPEQASSNGAVYPLQRKFTLQLNVTF